MLYIAGVKVNSSINSIQINTLCISIGYFNMIFTRLREADYDFGGVNSAVEY
jgi:hypothetical protein